MTIDFTREAQLDEWREYVDADGTGDYDDDTADEIAEALLDAHVHAFNQIAERLLIRWDIDQGRITGIDQAARDAVNDVDYETIRKTMDRSEDAVVCRFDQIEESILIRRKDNDRGPVHGTDRH